MNKAGNMSMFGSFEVESGTYVSKAILEKKFQIKREVIYNGMGM